MQFPNNKDDREDYMTKAQERAFSKFMESETLPRHEYTNSAGVMRRVLTVRYPIGCVTDMTVWHVDRNSGKRTGYYHTPLAKEPGGMAVVAYEDESGVPSICKSDEWLKWLGKDSKEVPYHTPEPTAIEVARKEGMITQAKNTIRSKPAPMPERNKVTIRDE